LRLKSADDRALELFLATEQMCNASGLIGRLRRSEIQGNLNSRLYVVSLPTLVRLRKP
jgi:hypothetical protein